MTERAPLDKLAILLPHWIEHTEAHVEEMRRWQSVAVAAGPEAARRFAAAIDALRRSADELEQVAAALPREH